MILSSNKVIFRFLFVMILVILTGCVDKSKKVLSKAEKEEYDTVFDLKSIEEEGNEILGAYYYGINNADNTRKEINILYDEISLDITHFNIGSKSNIGWLVFVDGIPQVVKYGKQEFIMPIVSVDKESETNIQMLLEPLIDRNKARHKFDIACIFEPTYRGNRDYMGYGVYGSELPLCPYEIKGDFSNVQSETIKQYGEIKNLPEEFAQKYTKIKRDGTLDSRIDKSDLLYELTMDDQEVYEGFEFKDESEIDLILFGKLDETYRITAFINNELNPLFDGASTVDAPVTRGKITSLPINIEKGKLDDCNSLYFVIVPISDANRDLDLVLTKTKSYTIIG